MGKWYLNKITAILAVLALSGCLQDKVEEGGTEVDITPPGSEQPTPDPATYVCNPLDDGSGAQDSDQGVHGELFYVPPGGPQYSSVSDYINHATPVPVDLYFNQLFIPTRPFDRGFVTQSGITLTAGDGVTTLYEWFGIRFEGNLQLAPAQAAGNYQLAVLSDDGAVLSVGASDSALELINNDGWTPTRMRCATAPVSLAAGQRLPFTLDYFQGPRYHIALIMMWRPWPASPADVNDPLCDRSGNNFWFDSNQNPPAPTNNYNALLARGWTVVAPENLVLPGAQEENPCNAPAPVLSGLSVGSVGSTTATVSWLTDIPATSQVVVTEVATGAVSFVPTPENPNLILVHSVPVSGLKTNTQYRVAARSKSSSGLSADSNEVIFRTAR